MSWLTRGWSIKLSVTAVLAAGAVLALATRRREELWHTLADRD